MDVPETRCCRWHAAGRRPLPRQAWDGGGDVSPSTSGRTAGRSRHPRNGGTECHTDGEAVGNIRQLYCLPSVLIPSRGRLIPRRRPPAGSRRVRRTSATSLVQAAGVAMTIDPRAIIRRNVLHLQTAPRFSLACPMVLLLPPGRRRRVQPLRRRRSIVMSRRPTPAFVEGRAAAAAEGATSRSSN